jgi:hypothetical protein
MPLNLSPVSLPRIHIGILIFCVSNHSSVADPAAFVRYEVARSPTIILPAESVLKYPIPALNKASFSSYRLFAISLSTSISSSTVLQGLFGAAFCSSRIIPTRLADNSKDGDSFLFSQISEIYSEIVVVMMIDEKIHKIIKADCSLATDLSSEFVQEILIGQNLKNFQQIEDRFNKKYFGLAKKALIAASRVCHEKYLQTQKIV